jgi:hypothetical protein
MHMEKTYIKSVAYETKSVTESVHLNNERFAYSLQHHQPIC